MYRGGPPKPTGVFDSQTEFPPTKLSELYHAGTMPCRVELVSNEDENSKTGRPKGGRTIKWLVPVSEIELDKMLPIFVEGLREKMEPQTYLARRGLEDLISKVTVKKLLAALRSIVYPLKDNLRTLDEDIVVSTL
mgnify:CR=1 FL=1